MDRSARCTALLLALLGALLSVQLAVAVGETGTQPYPNEAAGDNTEVAAEGDEASTGSISRMLWQTSSSKSCLSADKCHRWYDKPGCCNKKCVNLGNNSKHCGRCGKCCPKNTVCKSGKCRKVSTHKPPVVKSQCGSKKPCGKEGQKCCHRRCSDLKDDSYNCGQCGKKCDYDSYCCGGKCKPNNNHNCGRSGKRCKFGALCCKGVCKFVHKSDRENCGACGKECHPGVKCKYGLCGYGH